LQTEPLPTGSIAGGGLNRIEYLPGSPDRIAVTGRFPVVRGVYTMDVTSPGVWSPLLDGLSRVVAVELDYDPASDLLALGTMGRGAWLTEASCAPGAGTPWYRDEDEDGFGDPAATAEVCNSIPGYIPVGPLGDATSGPRPPALACEP
jgi:hypothetical protein